MMNKRKKRWKMIKNRDKAMKNDETERNMMKKKEKTMKNDEKERSNNEKW